MWRLLLLLVVVLLFLVSCGGGDDDSEAAPADPATAEAVPEPAPPEEPPAEPPAEAYAETPPEPEEASPEEAFAAAGCEFVTAVSDGKDHVVSAPEGFEYSTFPPTSGPHYQLPKRWDVYDEPVDQLKLIHNLEHAGIVVQYGDAVSEEGVQEIVAWYQASPEGIIVAPLPELGSEIALTAWTRLAMCTVFNDDAFSAFRDTYRFNGPETRPRSTYEPGQY